MRYADDLVILCRTEKDAQEALRRLGIVMERLELKLHPTKTRMVNLSEGQGRFRLSGVPSSQGTLLALWEEISATLAGTQGDEGNSGEGASYHRSTATS